MKASDWIVALFCLGCGTGITGFWISRLAARKVALDQYVMRLHLAAEFITSAVLVAAGIATTVDARARATVVLVGLALGLLVYASVQSPALYPEERQTRVALAFTLVLALGVLVLRLATL